MRRAVVAALVAAAVLPGAAAAQFTPDAGKVWGPRVRVTPFVGTSPTVGRSERWTVFGGSAFASSQIETDLGAGPVVGATLEVRAAGRFAFIASGVYVNRGQTQWFSSSEGEVFAGPGSDFIVAKAGVAMRLREPISDLQFRQLSASIFAAPALVHERPDRGLFSDPMLTKPINHWGANVGLEAEMPLGHPNFAFQAAVEDYVILWDNRELAERFDAVAARDGFTTDTSIDIDPSHMLVFRAGLSVRFR